MSHNPLKLLCFVWAVTIHNYSQVCVGQFQILCSRFREFKLLVRGVVLHVLFSYNYSASCVVVRSTPRFPPWLVMRRAC